MISGIDKKILALSKPVWGLPEVRAYLGCSKWKAYHEIAHCRVRFGGAIGTERQVKRDRFLEMLGTDYRTEIQNAYIEKEAEQIAKAKREQEIYPSTFQNKK